MYFVFTPLEAKGLPFPSDIHAKLVAVLGVVLYLSLDADPNDKQEPARKALAQSQRNKWLSELECENIDLFMGLYAVLDTGNVPDILYKMCEQKDFWQSFAEFHTTFKNLGTPIVARDFFSEILHQFVYTGIKGVSVYKAQQQRCSSEEMLHFFYQKSICQSHADRLDAMVSQHKQLTPDCLVAPKATFDQSIRPVIGEVQSLYLMTRKMRGY